MKSKTVERLINTIPKEVKHYVDNHVGSILSINKFSNMKFKKLSWSDNVLEKYYGYFEINASIKILDIYFTIRNYKYYGDAPTNKFYLMCSPEYEHIKCSNLEDAKLKAQEHFENTILNLFFE